MTRYRYRLITFGLMALAAMLLSAVGVMLFLMPYFPPKLILHCDFHLIAACIGVALLCVFTVPPGNYVRGVVEKPALGRPPGLGGFRQPQVSSGQICSARDRMTSAPRSIE